MINIVFYWLSLTLKVLGLINFQNSMKWFYFTHTHHTHTPTHTHTPFGDEETEPQRS